MPDTWSSVKLGVSLVEKEERLAIVCVCVSFCFFICCFLFWFCCFLCVLFVVVRVFSLIFLFCIYCFCVVKAWWNITLNPNFFVDIEVSWIFSYGHPYCTCWPCSLDITQSWCKCLTSPWISQFLRSSQQNKPLRRWDSSGFQRHRHRDMEVKPTFLLNL